MHVVHRELLDGKHGSAVRASVVVAREDLVPSQMDPEELNPRRMMLGKARRYVLDFLIDDDPKLFADDAPPRLTLSAIKKTFMSRSREKILANLDEMYREAFERAKEAGDAGQQAALDFSYRREQLYFEILLDIRDGQSR
jgi:hypothetical protein